MSLPATLFLFGWLIRETFRQALAARTFWLMLSVSLAGSAMLPAVRRSARPLPLSGSFTKGL